MPHTHTEAAASGATEQIEALQQRIEQLKHQAAQELKVKLAEARSHVADLQAQIDALNGELGFNGKAAKSKPAERKTLVKVTIEAIVEAIRNGSTNYRAVANALNASPANVANKIKAEGAAAGISSEGQKANFKLVLK